MRNREAGVRAVWTALWILAAPLAHAQTGGPFTLPAAELLAQASAMPPRDGFSATFLIDESRFELDEEHRLTWSRHRVYRVDYEDAIVMLGQVQAHWDPNRQLRPEIRARVVTRDGREHPFDPATLADETAEEPDLRIFNDLRLLRGPLPAIAAGSVVEVQLRIVDVEPQFAAGRVEQAYLAVDGAVERTRIVVSAPASLPLRYTTRLLPEAQLSEEVRDGRRFVTLEQGPLAIDAMDFDLEAIGEQAFWPHFQFSTGESWDAVAMAYAAMAEPFVRADEVRALLPPRLPDDRDAKVAALLEFLHERVRYTGVLFGVGKLVPNPPSVTLERRFGDCKDKAVVFASLLRATGLPAELVLLNSGTGTDVDPDLPGMGRFNHMIVHVPGERPLWIDPTVEHMNVGEMPTENRGRWALVIVESGDALRRTPEAQPADQSHRVVHEMRLAEFGPADLHVSGRVSGSEAERLRRTWSKPGAAAAGQRDELLRTIHSARSISGFRSSDDPSSRQLTYQFEARGVADATTYLNVAVVDQSYAALFGRMPFGLLMDDETLARIAEQRADAGRRSPQRTAGWVFEPFQAERRLRIVLQAGFQPLALPEHLELELGPARFTRQFERDESGHVVATIRVDSSSGRYTVEQGRSFRSAFLEHQHEFAVQLHFEHDTAILLKSGDEPGAFRRHREYMAAEPGRAVHLMRASHDLLAYGLVPEARELARRATRLEPKNALAFTVLGSALEQNEAGQRFARGFERDAAIKAHREAIRLDPEYHWFQLNLAGVAEYSVDGIAFGPGAELELSLASLRKYLEANPYWDLGRRLIINCLWRMGRYDEVASEAAGLPQDSEVQPWRLASRVMTVGARTALREDASRGAAALRRYRIEMAVTLLLQLRQYEEVRELLGELGGESRFGTGIDSALLQLFGATVRAEELPEPPVTAAGAVESLLRLALMRETNTRELAPWISERARWNGDVGWLVDRLREALREPPAALAQTMGGRHEFVRDVALANVAFEESEAPGGARSVTLQLRGMSSGVFFLVPEAGGWRVLTLAPAWHPVGREVLARLDAGDAASARAWLELAREVTEKDESYRESTWLRQLARVLPRDAQDPDEATLRLAAHFVLAGPAVVGASVDDMRRAETLAASDEQRAAWHWLMYVAALHAGDHELQIHAARGIEEPESADAFRYQAQAQHAAGRWEDVERTSRVWLERYPTDKGALEWLAAALSALGRPLEALEIRRTQLRRGRADPESLNDYAWQALIADAVDEDAIQAAENSLKQLSPQRSFPAGHTLACLYAVVGRVTEARDLKRSLLKQFPQMDAQSGALWLIRGLIFEHLGEVAAAIRAYRKVEAPEAYFPSSVHAVAMARLAKLDTR